MPNLLVPLEATQEAVTHHAIHGMIKQVMQLTGIDAKTPMYMLNDEESTSLPGTTLLDQQQVKLGHSGKLNVTYLEEYNQSAVINTPVRHDEERFIFDDSTLGVRIKPIYSSTEVTINFTYRADSKFAAEKWCNDLKVRLGDDRQSQLYELDYHFPIPKPVLAVLFEIYKARELQSGYGIRFGEYLKAHLTNRATSLHNQAGKQALLVINESQVGVQGWHDNILPPQPERVDGGGAYVTSFTYKFLYQKPVELHFIYPQMVHNTILPTEMITVGSHYSIEDRRRMPGLFYEAFETAKGIRIETNGPLTGVRIPKWDEWIPKVNPRSIATLATMLTKLDQSKLHDIADLNTMGSYQWHPIFKQFFSKEAKYVTQRRGASFMYLHLYQGELPVEDGNMTMTPDLQVQYKLPLNMRKTYHLAVSLVIDFGLLSKRAKEAMSDNGLATLYLFRQLDRFFDLDKAKGWLINGWLPPKYIEWFIGTLKDRGTWENSGGNNWGNQGWGDSNGWGPDGPGIGPWNMGGNNRSPHRVMYISILGTRRGDDEWPL